MTNLFEKISGVIKDADRTAHLNRRSGRQAKKLKNAKKKGNKQRGAQMKTKISGTNRRARSAASSTFRGSLAAAQQGVRFGAAAGAAYAAPSYATVGFALGNFVE